MLKLILLIVFLLKFSPNHGMESISEAEELFKVLIDNLRVDPFLLGNIGKKIGFLLYRNSLYCRNGIQ